MASRFSSMIADCCATLPYVVCYRALRRNHMKRTSQASSARIRRSDGTSRAGKLHEARVIAEEQGLLRGERTQVVRGRMPKALVTRAKKRSGIVSDTEL